MLISTLLLAFYLYCYVFKDPAFLRVFQPNFCMYFSSLPYHTAAAVRNNLGVAGP
jgi:hypothetical protein